MTNLKRQLLLNVLIIFLAVVIFNGVSYSANTNPNEDNKDLLIETGNMQVVLNVPKDRYDLLGTKNKMSDEVGKAQAGYDFTITNTGNIPIEYYEIRLVDEENKISTLPHKYLKFIINKDNDNYSSVKNLGDNDNVLYSGKNLEVGKSARFNLKLWIDDKIMDIYNKELYGALEVTLYQKDETSLKYVLYESEEGFGIPFRTMIDSPITSSIPIRDGYEFLGWSRKFNGDVDYVSGDTYRENNGATLYAIWKKVEND